MINNNYANLIQKLLDATIEGRLSWQKSSTPDEFFITISDYRFTIKKQSQNRFSLSSNNQSTFIIYLANINGEIIDMQRVKNDEEDFQFVGYLFDAARRSYYKVDNVVKMLTENI